MANNVFANGLEVACKAADGISSAAFPDVCWTPKEPVPFANTAKAKDLANGTVTVFISGKPVAQKDKSYFKTSSGDYGARGAKGFTTGAKNGKAYFRSWSMNVKVEGYNVCRHTDSMTHNHGSMPGNTPLWKYLDTWYVFDPCSKEKERMNKACGKSKHVQTLNWKKKNCKLLSFKPLNIKNLENPTKKLKELEAKIAETDIMSSVISEAKDAALNIAMEKGIKLGLKVVASKLVPIAGWIYSAATAADDIAQADYYMEMYNGAQRESQRILDSIKNVKQDIQSTIDAIKKGDFEGAAKKIADWQRSAATANKCIRARKCMLVPMKDTDAGSGGMKGSKGCCPGQTGHHLIPEAFMSGSGCQGRGNPAKHYANAPTVCVEGTNQNHGSHGALHAATTEMLLTKKGRLLPDRKMDYEDVRNGVIKAHAKTFPFSTCSRACLKEQLDNYYKKCKKLSVTSKGMGALPANIKIDAF